MALHNIVLISTFIVCAFSNKTEPEPPFEPCNKDDLQCLQTATQSAMAKLYDGVPELDIKRIDPLNIPILEGAIDDETGLVFHFKNVTISGLKNLNLVDFKIDTDEKTANLQIKVEITVSSEVDVEYTKLSKIIPGHYSAVANVIALSEYGYKINDVNGVEYFEVAPETNTCKNEEDPVVSLKIQLNDIPEDKEQYTKLPELNKADLRKKTMCQFTIASATAFIQNLRASAKVYPKSAFFKDV